MTCPERSAAIAHSASLLRHVLLTLSLTLVAAPALADDDCDAPVELWQPREAVRQMAIQRGWEIRRFKIDDGCYEIRGTDADGRAFKAKIDPETLEVVKMKHRDHERDRERAREREQRPGSTAPRGEID